MILGFINHFKFNYVTLQRSGPASVTAQHGTFANPSP